MACRASQASPREDRGTCKQQPRHPLCLVCAQYSPAVQLWWRSGLPKPGRDIKGRPGERSPIPVPAGCFYFQ